MAPRPKEGASPAFRAWAPSPAAGGSGGHCHQTDIARRLEDGRKHAEDSPVSKEDDGRRVRTLFLSDLHLGTR
uniref:hypothetical protein n=1 Tax=Pantanalinema rosaneae TaxID=1620701 RepID=UPI003D6DC3D1